MCGVVVAIYLRSRCDTMGRRSQRDTIVSLGVVRHGDCSIWAGFGYARSEMVFDTMFQCVWPKVRVLIRDGTRTREFEECVVLRDPRAVAVGSGGRIDTAFVDVQRLAAQEYNLRWRRNIGDRIFKQNGRKRD